MTTSSGLGPWSTSLMQMRRYPSPQMMFTTGAARAGTLTEPAQRQRHSALWVKSGGSYRGSSTIQGAYVMNHADPHFAGDRPRGRLRRWPCLLYTSDAAD